MTKTFSSRQLRQHAQELADKFGGVAALADKIGCNQATLSKFISGFSATNVALFRGLGVRFDARQGLYVQDDSAAAEGAAQINIALAEENHRLREQIKSLHIKLSKRAAI
jgi:hypothetical protein